MKDVTNYLQNSIVHVLVIVAVAAVFFWVGSKLIQFAMPRIFFRAYHRTLHPKDLAKRRNTLVELMVNVWRVLVIVIAILTILKVFLTPQEMAPLFASAGIIGVALGFGSQSLVKDFLSGVFIVSENQYRVGDTIEIDKSSGVVEKIGARSTVIRDLNGNVHFFPNGTVQHVINKTMGYSKSRFEITVTPDSNIDKAIELIDKAGKKLAEEPKWKVKIIDAPTFLMVGDVTAKSVSLIVSGTTQPSDQWAVTAEMRRRILELFEKNKIELGS